MKRFPSCDGSNSFLGRLPLNVVSSGPEKSMVVALATVVLPTTFSASALCLGGGIGL